jgi:8-oxo-dGTP diphosphatase
MPMKDGTLCFAVQGSRPPLTGAGMKVLLGFKKVGFGQGKFDGFGGKIEPGETPLAAAIRELEEESGLKAMPEAVQYVAHLVYLFPAKPEWSQIVHAFVATKWAGTPVESVEMIPRWFGLQGIPYGQMWDDSSHWLPRILAGGRVQGRFVFQPDNATVGHVVVEPLDELCAAQLAARTESQPADWGWGRNWADELEAVSLGLRRRFPHGDDSFQIMTCLLEECGELAQQVNHFEGSGIKREKYGPPDRAKLAQEVKGVLLSALRVAQHYGVEDELRASIASSYGRLVAAGHIQEGDGVQMPGENNRAEDLPELPVLEAIPPTAADGSQPAVPPPGRHIIRRMRMAHCKKGPALCEECRRMNVERICLLDISPPQPGQVQRRVIAVRHGDEELWREFDVVRTFETEAEARQYAVEHGIEDVELAPPTGGTQ